MEPITIATAPGAPASIANPTDTAICRLLASGPVPTTALADQLGVPARTVRYRLAGLRQAGAVVSGTDGLHRLAAPTPGASAGSSSVARPDAAPGVVAGWQDTLAHRGAATGDRVRPGVVALLVAIGLALAVAALLTRRAPCSATSSSAAPLADEIDWERRTTW
jgi:Helix-turn-helix domain